MLDSRALFDAGPNAGYPDRPRLEAAPYRSTPSAWVHVRSSVTSAIPSLEANRLHIWRSLDKLDLWLERGPRAVRFIHPNNPTEGSAWPDCFTRAGTRRPGGPAALAGGRRVTTANRQSLGSVNLRRGVRLFCCERSAVFLSPLRKRLTDMAGRPK